MCEAKKTGGPQVSRNILARTSSRSHLPACLIAALIGLPALCYSQPSQNDLAQQAAQLEQSGNFQDAERLWAQLAARHPADFAAQANLGLALSHLGRYKEAAAAYRKALQLNPHQAPIQFNLGLAEFKQGHFAAAIAAFRVASAAPALPKAQIDTLLGLSYYGEHSYAQAVSALTVAAKADPENPELHYVLAESCLRSAKIDCAMRESRRVLELKPDSAEAHILLGEAFDGTQQTKEAIAEFSAAEAANPAQPEVHFGLGYLYWKERQYDEASNQFEQELQHDSQNAQSYTYLGDIAYRNGDDSAAKLNLKKAIELQPNIRLAYFDLGCV
jgi:tetratricopeptide (TPR) repeat protein